MKHFRYGDFIVIGIILLAAGLSFRSALTKKGGLVKVEAAGKSYEYSLQKDGIYKVQGSLGISVIEIKDGRVRIIDSPCPNKVCIHQRWSKTIACLPNDVLVYVEDNEEEELDAIAE
ncbi:MAG: NusG domain II-containing protein [Treponema sp.]|nr:NusG domain II-containing protein [Treponema sp.]